MLFTLVIYSYKDVIYFSLKNVIRFIFKYFIRNGDNNI